MGFVSAWPEYEKFKIGDQWPAKTEKTKDLPRPVFNMIDFVINHKKTSVLNQNIKMQFSPEELPTEETQNDSSMLLAIEGSKKYSQVAEADWENIKQDELNEEAIDDAVTNGTCIWHYFWNDEKTGGIVTKYKGCLDGEIIDPINTVCGNPQCRDAQKQPWWIISSRELVSKVKEMAKNNKLQDWQIALITGDKDTKNEVYDAAQHEVTDEDMVTVYTMYYKEAGKIFYTKSTKTVMFMQPKPLGSEMNPNGFTLYPIEVMAWKKRKKSIYGVSEVEGLIPNQKAINFNIAMMLLSVQKTAWPKIIQKYNMIRQRLTDAPGEVITDYSQDGGDGIKYMQPPTFPAMGVNIVDKVTELTRSFNGVSEVATGEPFSSDLNASAIIALQNQAKVPIESIQKRFYRSQKNIGKIWEQFYKNYYDIDRSMVVKDDNGEDTTISFNGAQYKDIPFRLKVDVGPSSMYSESLSMATLDKMHDSGEIDTDMYIELAPQNVMPFKEKLKKMLDDKKQQEQTNLGTDVMSVLSQMTPEEREAILSNPQMQQEILNSLQAQPEPNSNQQQLSA